MQSSTLQDLHIWFKKLAELPSLPAVHNIYSAKSNNGIIRLHNLKRYFEVMLPHQPQVLLVGEAPGYQGTYRTGVPFCSESIPLGPPNQFNLFGGEANGFHRVYHGDKVWKEPSATIVQRTLDEIKKPILIWSTFPLHPHQPGIELSNRAPNLQEITLGSQLLQELLTILQPPQIVAVGNIAHKCLTSIGIKTAKVRHPSHGGATQFRQQLLQLVAE